MALRLLLDYMVQVELGWTLKCKTHKWSWLPSSSPRCSPGVPGPVPAERCGSSWAPQRCRWLRFDTSLSWWRGPSRA